MITNIFYLMASLKKNTLYLYALTASNYLFGIASIPYLTRILGPSVYGNLGFAMAIGTYFNIIIDFGFILSGTKKVTENRNDIVELKKVFSAICIIKTTFLIILMAILGLLTLYVPEIKNNYFLLTLFLFVAFFSSILPDYLYRGLEDMKMIAVRGVLTRGMFTILTFIFIKRADQILLVPTFQLAGAVIAAVWIYVDVISRYKINFCIINLSYIYQIFRDSSQYFLSRIASSIYNVTNTVILGLIQPGSPVVGYYSSAEKFKILAAQGFSPISDSFYPYMIRTRNFGKLIKTTLLLEIPILLCCIIGFYEAKYICEIAFGQAYGNAYILLRWMIPVIALTLPSYMFGFPALTPLGKARIANLSVEIGMVNQLVGLVILCISDNISAVSLCILTFVSESIIFVIRIIAFIVHYNQVKNKTSVCS